MTSRLSLLRSRLVRVRRMRALLRAAAGVAALGSSLIIAAFVVFAIDFSFRLGVVERITVLLVAAAVIGWSFRRYAWPLLSCHESLTETALFVEQRQQIDSDLVAALQFDAATDFGLQSPRLAAAVVEYVSEATPAIAVFEGVVPRELWRRLAVFAVCLLAVICSMVLMPAHVAAFFNRVCLGSAQYPTRTHIERILVNQTCVYGTGADDSGPANCKAAQGRPLTFLVQCSGLLPANGTVEVTAASGNAPQSPLQLTPISASQRVTWLRDAVARIGDARQSTSPEISRRLKDELVTLVQCDAPQAVQSIHEAERANDLAGPLAIIERVIRDFDTTRGEYAIFKAEIRRLNDDLKYEIAVGDAILPAAVVNLIPLPVVQFDIVPKPPAYASAAVNPATKSGSQMVVLEASSIEARVKCLNKPLESVWIMIDQGEASKRLELAAIDQGRSNWSPVADGLLATNVSHELAYQLQVIDVDGLSLETPIRGIIRVQPDKPPSAIAKIIHKVVMPAAVPAVSYLAEDDFGISRLGLTVEVERGGHLQQAADAPLSGSDSGSEVNAKAKPAEIETYRFDVLPTTEPSVHHASPLAGTYSLQLAPLKLAKGDRLKLVLEALDYRGDDHPGHPVRQPTTSEPVTLEIGDEAAVLAAIAETDKRSEQQLSEIIERQLSRGAERP